MLQTSRQWVYADVLGNQNLDGKTARMAVTTKLATDLAEDEWHPAEKVGNSFRVMIGPDSEIGQLEVGTYRIYVRIDAAPELPEIKAGTIQIRLV